MNAMKYRALRLIITLSSIGALGLVLEAGRRWN
jgi:hypothetical protein